jgi:uncharacterized SAM-binding protein YcdF (DUF218 family)
MRIMMMMMTLMMMTMMMKMMMTMMMMTRLMTMIVLKVIAILMIMMIIIVLMMKMMMVTVSADEHPLAEVVPVGHTIHRDPFAHGIVQRRLSAKENNRGLGNGSIYTSKRGSHAIVCANKCVGMTKCWERRVKGGEGRGGGGS